MRAVLLFCAAIVCPAIHATAEAATISAEIAAYRALVAQDARLARVGYRLAAANAEYCARKERNPGWVIHDIAQYPDADIAKAAFGFEQPVQISALVAGGPADKAGILADDGFIGLDEATLYWPAMPVGKTGYERLESFKQLFAERTAEKPGLPVKLLRRGTAYDAVLVAPLVCASDFQIDPSANFNAGAQGDMVSVSSALAEYAANDGELAAITSHELAHNILGHRTRLDALKVKRGIGRSFGKSRKAILQTEIEADQLSIWLLSNAGYPPSRAITFWQRYRTERGGSLLSDGTHLGWAKRIAIMQQQADLIAVTPAIDGKRAPPLLANPAP
jgi:beta-barrel assembly-enhancing protease